LRPGCAVRRVSDLAASTIGGAQWVLLAPKSTAPCVGALVLVTSTHGSEWLREYHPDADDESRVCLRWSDESARPLSLPRDEIESIRVVIGPLASFQR